MEVERERELRGRLSRQAAAHNDHVKDVLRVQQHELQTAFDVRLAGLVDRERTALQQKIATWTGRMQGIDKALAGLSVFSLLFRPLSQATGYASQHIWCLSQARINWEGCVRKGILRKNGGDGRVGAPISLDGVAVHPDC